MPSFKKGQSGNPAGRPAGSKNKRTLAAQALHDAAEDVTKAVIAAAREGDMQAARLVLERIQPPVRPVSQPTPFEFDASLPASQQATQVIQAVADGSLPADIASVLLDCLHKHVALMQAEGLEARIMQLEHVHCTTPRHSGVMHVPMESLKAPQQKE